MAKRIVYYKCPFSCDKKFDREKLLKHVDDYHQDELPEGFSSLRYVFHYVNKKPMEYHGICTECKGPTEWDEKVGRYKRQCGKKSCHDSYVKKFEENMVKKTGHKRVTETQKGLEDMLKRRKISGVYTFKNGEKKEYVGSYEKNCLEFIDKVMDIDPNDVMSPGPTMEYVLDGVKHYYITDFYYQPYNLIIEVKDGGDNPNKRNMPEYRKKQMAKEKFIIDNTDYNYIRLTNNDMGQLLTVMADLKMQLVDGSGDRVIHVNENGFRTDPYVITTNINCIYESTPYRITKSVKITDKSIENVDNRYTKHLRISNNTEGYLLYSSDKFIGLFNLENKDNGEKWIQALEVAEEYRHAGYGKYILKEAESHGAQYLSVNKKNTIAFEMYKKNGWKVYEETDSMYFMSKNASVNEAFLESTINTPQKLLDYMKDIKYGFVDPKGVVHNGEAGTDFAENYRLQSPKEVDKSRVGVCWDCTEFERAWFSQSKYDYNIYFLALDNKKEVPTHTFLVYKDGSNYCWFEHAWEIHRGIKKFSSEKEVFDEVLNNIRKFYHDDKSSIYLFKLSKKPKYGCTCKEFMDYALNQPEINIESINESNNTESSANNFIRYDLNDPKASEYFKNLKMNKDDYSGEVLVDSKSKEEIGHVLIGNKKDKGYITDLYVESKYRRQGFGSMLLKDAINKYGGIDLSVEKSNNIALNMYKNNGFVIIKEYEEKGKDMYWMKLKSKLSKDNKVISENTMPICPKCNSSENVVVKIAGEPIFYCKACNSYVGDVPMNEAKVDTSKISYSEDFKDVKNIVDTLTKEELSHICNGTFKNSPYNVYRKVCLVNNDPAAFIDVYSIPSEMKKDEAVVVCACKKKYRGNGLIKLCANGMAETLKEKGIKSVTWETTKDNEASSAIAKSLGFIKSEDINSDDDNYILILSEASTSLFNDNLEKNLVMNADKLKQEEKHFKGRDGITDYYIIKLRGYKKKYFRGRSELLLMKGNSVLLVIDPDGKGYSLPGGGWNEGEAHSRSAQRECEEEVGYRTTPPKYFLTYASIFPPQAWVRKYVDAQYWWYGEYNELFCAEYNGTFSGNVDDEDKDLRMKQNAKFYDISLIWNMLIPPHQIAIKRYFNRVNNPFSPNYIP